LEKLPDHKEELRGIAVGMKSTDTKTSVIKNTRRVLSFDKASKKRRRFIAAEMKSKGVHNTPAAGNG
jgi:hypothetical protein